MKYFVISDIHSFCDEMITALKSAGFEENNPEHTLISCGDLLDRGDKSIETLRYINAIPRKILIRGNHEDLLEECIAREEFWSHDFHNGTVKTIMNLCSLKEEYIFFNGNYRSCFKKVKTNKELNAYLKSLQDYAEIGDYIFVHGWIPSRKTSPNHDWRLGDWRKARWFNGMEKWHQGAIVEGKTIVCGHFHTSWGHCRLRKNGSEFGDNADFTPFIGKGICAIDACTAYSKKVNCITLEI